MVMPQLEIHLRHQLWMLCLSLVQSALKTGSLLVYLTAIRQDNSRHASLRCYTIESMGDVCNETTLHNVLLAALCMQSTWPTAKFEQNNKIGTGATFDKATHEDDTPTSGKKGSTRGNAS